MLLGVHAAQHALTCFRCDATGIVRQYHGSGTVILRTLRSLVGRIRSHEGLTEKPNPSTIDGFTVPEGCQDAGRSAAISANCKLTAIDSPPFEETK